MSSPDSPPAPATPKTLAGGRYLVSRKLAEGGTAVVHLGWDSVDEEWRAIKTLLPEYSRRPALRHRFEIEARTMSGLVHPNIIRVYEAGQEGEIAWLVMELADGGSVVDWIERHGRMPPRLACQVALDLCAGIGFAHGMGVIHRDIKPQNVLVSKDGVCKVTDFGIAQVVQETRMTMTGTVMGTIGYMAPEQHESAKHADARADIYSVAATLYTLLVAEAPTHLFMAEDDDFAGIPPVLVEVIRKASQYRREARYETTDAMAAAIRAARDTLPEDPPCPPLARADGPPEPEPPTAHTVRAESLVPPDRHPSHDAPVVTVPPPVVRIRSQQSEEPRQVPVVAPPGGPPMLRGSLDASLDSSRIDPTRSLSTDLSTDARALLRLKPRRDDGRIRRYALMAGAGSFLAAVVLAVVVAGGAMRINAFRELEAHQESLLYEQIHEERAIIDFIPAAQLPERDAIRALFDQADQGTPEEREEAANRLVTSLDAARRQVEARGQPNQEHVVKQLRESVRRIQARLTESRAASERVEKVRSDPLGKVASWFGF